MGASLSELCGQLLVVGLAATTLRDHERRVLELGHRGGVILFRRNIQPTTPDVDGFRALVALNRDVALASSKAGLPPLLGVDQEGGRVARIGAPAMKLPPMRAIGALGDTSFASTLAEAHARELAALGFTMSFAPVADVHTRPENPIIGDRAFSHDPHEVARFAGAWAAGLSRGGLLSCAKHFPGHGDTTVDSHLALPRVDRPRADLIRTEVEPFRDLASKVDAMMTAHVVYDALDPSCAATLSHAICTDLLRGELGFRGVLFSDDLEMKALSSPTDAAVLAIEAGCDTLLVCNDPDLPDAVHEALVRKAEASASFRARCEEAFVRFSAIRRKTPPRPAADASLAERFAASHVVASELATRLESRRETS